MAAVVLALFTLLSGATAAAGSLTFGVVPYTSPRELLVRYQPLRIVAAHAFGQPVDLISAPTLTTFLRRALEQSYDLILVPGNYALVLADRGLYHPFLAEAGTFRALVVVGRASGIARAADLAGADVLGLDPTGLATLWGQAWLAENRVTVGRLRTVSAGDSIAELVAHGVAQAGMIASMTFDGLSPTVRDRLAILAQSPPFPGRVMMIATRHAARADTLTRDLLAYADSPEGRERLRTVGIPGLRRIDPEELQGAARFAQATAARLGEAPP